VRDFRHIFTVLHDEGFVALMAVLQTIEFASDDGLKAFDAADGIEGELEAVHVVEHRHVERSGGGAFFFVAADVNEVMTLAPVGEPVNQPRVAVKGKYDGFVGGEDGIELFV